MRTDIELEFADGRYMFRLNIAGISELQEKAGVGFGEVFARLLAGRYKDGEGGSFGMPTEGRWFIRDLTETIRLGLIGGGQGEVDGEPVEVTPIIANRLVTAYVLGRPLKEAWNLAAAIVYATVEGVEDRAHEVKKKSVRTRKTTAGSTSPKRSASSPASGSTPSPEPA